MIKLKFPPIVGQEKEIYIKCANAFTNKKDYAKKALAYVDEVEKYSSAYEKYVPQSIACFTHIKLDKDKKEIINKIYEQKFAKEKSVGRKYYDIIMANANGRCPICGGGKLKNLDHFLPKSKYPLLCVTPLNLIPTCRDCNMEKRAVISNNYYEIPFHPYLEDMVDQWVECSISFCSDSTFSLKFNNGYASERDSDLKRKYDAHMRITDLAATFTSRAEEEVENVISMYKKVLKQCGKDVLYELLLGAKQSAEDVDINSWKSALYRELIRQCDGFAKWLGKHQNK